jgi:hypothetical protein
MAANPLTGAFPAAYQKGPDGKCTLHWALTNTPAGLRPDKSQLLPPRQEQSAAGLDAARTAPQAVGDQTECDGLFIVEDVAMGEDQAVPASGPGPVLSPTNSRTALANASGWSRMMSV